MKTQQPLYDKADKYSIFEYSKGLLGKCLEEAIYPTEISKINGKGKLGQMVEQYYFGYELNSNQEADFREAGVELKCTPLKELANKSLQIKERLVCTMIDYSEDYKLSFWKSHIYAKCACMLILFYLHQANVPVEQLKFIYSVLWHLPAKDLLIIEQDYKKIIGKIKSGNAHELSEGDTTYLGACRKGQKDDELQRYRLPNGEWADQPAPKRAFALKPQYMRTILKYIESSGSNAACNTSAFVDGYPSQLITANELEKNSFEDILLYRFKKYLGKSYEELCSELIVDGSAAKSKYAGITNAILTLKGTRGWDVTKSDEFQKSGIRIKTIRLNKKGKPIEAMSFENINYFDIIEEDSWYESRLYEVFSSRFLFVVFRESEDGTCRLEKAFFWTMPNSDLDEASQYWLNIKSNVQNDTIEPQYFYKESMHKKFHVRPKGKNAADLAATPSGGYAKKYCYWFNHDYIQSIVEGNNEK